MAKAVDFAGQQPGEEVQFIFRRHRSVMGKGLLTVLVIVVISFVPLYFYLNNGIGGGWTWFLPLFGIFLATILSFNTWVQWYYSLYIVTNRRIRQQLQLGLFRKSAVDVELNKVENIRYNIKGLQGSLFGYGTIAIQTMAGDLVMYSIDNCEEVYERLAIAVRNAGGDVRSDNELDSDEEKAD